MRGVEHLPLVHLRPTTGQLNDPNAPVQVGDTYHLFAQHNPNSAVHATIHWAHFTSSDLVRWQAHPPALTPGPGTADVDGCWSGSAVVVDGAPVLLYTGHNMARRHDNVCLAWPRGDGSTWVKDESNPVIPGPPPGLDVVVFRDPFIWRADGGGFGLLVGAGLADGRGTVLRYRSADLRTWTYVGALCTAAGRAFEGLRTGDAWECPQLARFGSRGLLVVSAWYPTHLDAAFFVSGHLVGDVLDPQVVGRLDHGPDFYAPALMVDSAGRCLLWGWSWEVRVAEPVLAGGWAGMLTLPRVVTLEPDGTPALAPAPELVALRGTARRWDGIRLDAGETVLLEPEAGDAVEVEATVRPEAAGRAWLRVRVSPGSAEFTEVGVDVATGTAYLSRDAASLDPRSAGGTFHAPCRVSPGESVHLRVYVDRSIVEVFTGDGRALTARIYPTRGDSVGLSVGSTGAAAVIDVRRWHLLGPVVTPA